MIKSHETFPKGIFQIFSCFHLSVIYISKVHESQALYQVCNDILFYSLSLLQRLTYIHLQIIVLNLYFFQSEIRNLYFNAFLLCYYYHVFKFHIYLHLRKYYYCCFKPKEKNLFLCTQVFNISENFTAFCITKLPSGNGPFHCYK